MSTRKRVSKKDSKTFCVLIVDMLKSIGALLDDDEHHFYDYVLPTTAGTLKISLDKSVSFDERYKNQTHVHCYTLFTRFDYPSLAVEKLGSTAVNPFSGKWNFHLPAHITPDQAVREIRNSFKRILITEAPKEDMQFEGLVNIMLNTAENNHTVRSDALDSLVQDTASMMVTNINNKGVEEQIRFLLKERGTAQVTLDAISTELEE